MNNVILAVSQNWKDEDFYRTALRKLHDASPLAQIRVTARLSGSGKEAREFAEVLGFEVVEFAKEPGRATAMISGRRYYWHEGDKVVSVEEVGPPADLFLGFIAGGGGIIETLYKQYLIAGQGRRPIVLYREKVQKNKWKDDVNKGIERAANRKEKPWLLSGWKLTKPS